jgi:hypothetical protein
VSSFRRATIGFFSDEVLSMVTSVYQGFEYSVVQTACPTGWKWTVWLPSRRMSTGKTSGRLEAIRCAQLAIEKGLAEHPEWNLRERYAELQRLRDQISRA